MNVNILGYKRPYDDLGDQQNFGVTKKLRDDPRIQADSNRTLNRSHGDSSVQQNYGFQKKATQLVDSEQNTSRVGIPKLKTNTPLNKTWDLLPPPDDDATPSLTSDDHYQRLHVHTLLSDQELKDLADRIENMNPNELLRNITKRIGSKSNFATVWKIVLQDKILAVKIEDINAKANLHIKAEKDEYDCIKKLSDSDTERKFILRPLAAKNGKVNVDGKTFEAKMIFMQIAIGDLAQVLEGGISPKELEQYVLDVFDALEFLAQQEIKHHDLHHKNVFIIRDQDRDRAVLGDFGNAKSVEFLNSNLDDFSWFFRTLKDHLTKKCNDFQSNSEQVKFLQAYCEKISKFQTTHYKRAFYDIEGVPWDKDKAIQLIRKLKADWISLPLNYTSI